MPTEKHNSPLWTHPARLPLGLGWKGYCTAPGHERELPADEQLRDSCNLGYARSCPWCPPDRAWEATRFGVMRESNHRIVLCYVRERDHGPIEHGTLEYDHAFARWNSSHPDARVQRMAECYLEAYLLRKTVARTSDLVSSPPL
jgi:hypothetical protein